MFHRLLNFLAMDCGNNLACFIARILTTRIAMLPFGLASLLAIYVIYVMIVLVKDNLLNEFIFHEKVLK